MSCCSIRWCGKNSKTSNSKTDGITFYRFPKEPDVKEKWLLITKRENWFPRKHSVICSRHFTEDCFYTMKNRRRLFNSAIPTLFLPLVVSDKTDTKSAQIKIEIEPSFSPHHDLTTLREIKQKQSDPEPTSQFDSLTKTRLCRRVSQLSSQVQDKNKTIKVLRDRICYLNRKMKSLKVMIKELERKNIVNECVVFDIE